METNDFKKKILLDYMSDFHKLRYYDRIDISNKLIETFTKYTFHIDQSQVKFNGKYISTSHYETRLRNFYKFAEYIKFMKNFEHFNDFLESLNEEQVSELENIICDKTEMLLNGVNYKKGVIPYASQKYGTLEAVRTVDFGVISKPSIFPELPRNLAKFVKLNPTIFYSKDEVKTPIYDSNFVYEDAYGNIICTTPYVPDERELMNYGYLDKFEEKYVTPLAVYGDFSKDPNAFDLQVEVDEYTKLIRSLLGKDKQEIFDLLSDESKIELILSLSYLNANDIDFSIKYRKDPLFEIREHCRHVNLERQKMSEINKHTKRKYPRIRQRKKYSNFVK